MKFALACCCILATFVCATASGNAGRAEQTASLRADVAEWSVIPSAGVVPAGRVRIVVRNLGATPHALALVRTRSFGERLRLDGARASVHPLATAGSVAPGQTVTFVVRLERGSYVLLDNLPWHYWKGTSAAFSVR
jgi:uncharacterized cupredoxin-like copper-binding protein